MSQSKRDNSQKTDAAQNGASNGLPRQGETFGPAYDPFGIYGTRSAQRIQAARRRRIVQKFAAIAGLVGLSLAICAVIFVPHVSTIKGERLGVVSPLAAGPVAATDKEGGVLLLPTESGTLLRFDPTKGTSISCLEADFPLRASPVVRGPVAFVPSENGILTALDWRQGKVLWQRPTGAALTARPTTIEWQFFVQRPLTSPPQNSVATQENPVEAPAPVVETVAKTQKLVVIGNDAGLVAGLEFGTGKIVWSRRVGAPVGNGLAAVPVSATMKTPRVLVPLLQDAGSSGGLWCLDARNGAVLWKYPADNRALSPQVAPPAYDRRTDRVFCADDTGALSCLDVKTGRKLWKKFARPRNSQSRELVLLRGEPMLRRYDFGAVVVLGANDGIVRCFAADDGKLLWDYDAGAPVRVRPAPLLQNLSDSYKRELIAIGCDSNFLPVLDPQSGRPICRLRASDAAPVGIIPVGEQLCTVTTSGVVEEFVF